MYIPRYQVKLVRDGSVKWEVKKITSPNEAAGMIQELLADADREHFLVVMLDTKNQVIGVNIVTTGSLKETIVHPRELFKPAILSNAAGVILAHNHVSGDVTPSPDDQQVTQKMVEAGKIMCIPVLDHLIVADCGEFCSMKEKGFM